MDILFVSQIPLADLPALIDFIVVLEKYFHQLHFLGKNMIFIWWIIEFVLCHFSICKLICRDL